VIDTPGFTETVDDLIMKPGHAEIVEGGFSCPSICDAFGLKRFLVGLHTVLIIKDVYLNFQKL